MKRSQKTLTVLASIVFCVLCSDIALAANEYSMDYSGGELLGDNNLRAESALTESLTGLLYGTKSVEYSNSAKWKTGYLRVQDSCYSSKYLQVGLNNNVAVSDDVGYTITNGVFSADINVKKISGENLSSVLSNDEFIAVSIWDQNGYFFAGQPVYQDSSCTTAIDGVKSLSWESGAKVFVEANTKLKYAINDKMVKSDQLYYLIGDIDGSQSFKILNSDNKLSASNMFAASAVGLQPTTGEAHNMFVPGEGYIYSQGNFGIESGAEVYVKLADSAQEDGLDIVYGFAHNAGSSVEYYAKRYKIDFLLDRNGTTSEITHEDIISKTTPTGPGIEKVLAYNPTRIVANTDIRLTDGNLIKAGSPISNDQLYKIVVDKEIVVTAYLHDDSNPKKEEESENSDISVPDTGIFTKTEDASSAIVLVIPIVLIVLTGMSRYFAVRFFSKNIKFNKK